MPDDPTALTFTLNGRRIEILVARGRPLADVLRDDLHETGVQIGCRNGDCGACTVLVDGASIKSCMMPCGRVADRAVDTLGGLALTASQLHPVQEAFWEENGFQCGYCLAGHVMCTIELLRANVDPARSEIEDALQGNLCRCTGYQNIMAAVQVAARKCLPVDGSADTDSS